MKPDFVFIGPTKSGTTWIDNYLRARGDVALPQRTKETYFFDKLYGRGLDWYESQFDSKSARLCVEVAPSLFGKPEAAKRLAKDLPQAQVVCMLRNPIDRAVSHYFHYLKAGAADAGFATVYATHADVLEAGLYFRHLSVWISLLGRERVHVLSYGDLMSDAGHFCATLCGLLELPFVAPPAALADPVNEAGVPRLRWLAALARQGADTSRRLGAHGLVNTLRLAPLRRLAFGATPEPQRKAAIREQVLQFGALFDADTRKLEALLSRDFSSWRTKRETSSRERRGAERPEGAEPASGP